jgi:hypothetical protein
MYTLPPFTYKRRGREGFIPRNHNTPMHTGCRAFILTEAQTCRNPHVHHVPLFFTYVSTPSLKSSRKTTTPLAHRRCHQAREEPRTTDNGEVDSLPLLSIFILLFVVLPPTIQVWRGCLPPEPSPLSGQKSRPVSIAYVPTAVRYRHDWPPTSSHPQVR